MIGDASATFCVRSEKVRAATSSTARASTTEFFRLEVKDICPPTKEATVNEDGVCLMQLREQHGYKEGTSNRAMTTWTV